MYPHTLASDFIDLIPVIAVGGGVVIALVWIVFATLDSIIKARAKETTRRELAAYVAEGSMTAADATNIINAGRSSKASAACPADFQPAAARRA